jgi:hypothetical protein
LVLPGSSSLDGGIEEFPLFRLTIRSSYATRSTRRAFAAASSSIFLACSAITASRPAHDPHSGADDGDSLTQP